MSDSSIMPSWYPPEKRCQELSAALRALRANIVKKGISTNKLLLETSEALRILAYNKLIPHYYLRDLIWIGSQFRLNAAGKNIIWSTAAALLEYVIRELKEENTKRNSFGQELNYVINSTFSELFGLIDNEELEGFLSKEELHKIEISLDEYRKADNGTFCCDEEKIKKYIDKLEDIASEIYLPGIRPLIMELVEAAKENSDASEARAALNYLIEEHDVVPDSLGYLGLVDDIYVLERARLKISEETTWEPLLEQLIKRKPFLSQIAFQEIDQSVRLSPYMKLICGAAIDSVSEAGTRNCIVIPEVGPVGIIAAFLTSLTFIIEAFEGVSSTDSQLVPGDDVCLDFGQTLIRARYAKDMKYGNQRFSTLQFGDGTCTVRNYVLQLMRKAPKPHKKLSKFAEFKEWEHGHTPDPLKFITMGKNKITNAPPITLFLTRKNRLDALLPLIKPMGHTIPELIGLKYISSMGTETDIGGAVAGVPMLWCCSDALTASDILLSDSAPEIGAFLTDDVDLASDFALTQGAISNADNICQTVLASLDKVNPTCDLIRGGYTPWLLKRKDVTPDISTKLKESKSQDGPIGRFQKRTYNQESSTNTFHKIREPEIEKLFQILENMKEISKENEDDSLTVVSLVLSQFLRRFLASPFMHNEREQDELIELLRNVMALASPMAPYEPIIKELSAKCDELIKSGIPENPRYEVVRNLVSSHKGKKIAIVCSSKPVAVRFKAASDGKQDFSGVNWVPKGELSNFPPFDVLIVPGWIETRAMRKIRTCGFSKHVDYVMYSFEEKWERRSKSSALGWEDRLGSQMKSKWKSIEKKYGAIKSPSFIHSGRETVITPKEPEREVPDFDWMTDRVIETVRKRVSTNDQVADLAKAHLTIFEDASTYILLPPHGNVVSIGTAMSNSASHTDTNKTEGLITCPVSEVRQGDLLAFPVSKHLDLIGELAEKVLDDPKSTRELAGMWRIALKEYMLKKYISVRSLRSELQKAGLKRHAVTLKNWIYSENIIAPSNWQKAIGIISDVTEYPPLKEQLSRVLNAVENMYAARQKAACLFVEQLLAADLSIDGGSFKTTIEGCDVEYRVLRVLSIDPPIDIPRDQMGKLLSLSDNKLQDKLQKMVATS